MVSRLLCCRRPIHLSIRPIIAARISLVTIQWTSLAPFDHHLSMKIAIIDAVKKSDLPAFMPLAMR